VSVFLKTWGLIAIFSFFFSVVLCILTFASDKICHIFYCKIVVWTRMTKSLVHICLQRTELRVLFTHHSLFFVSLNIMVTTPGVMNCLPCGYET
jgi:hypothetical protein